MVSSRNPKKQKRRGISVKLIALGPTPGNGNLLTGKAILFIKRPQPPSTPIPDTEAPLELDDVEQLMRETGTLESIPSL